MALQKLKTEIQVKIEEILTDKDSKDWYNSLESDSTKETWPIAIAQYLLYRKMAIKDLVKAFKRNNLRECKRLQAYVNELKEKRAPKTLNWLLSSIRSRLEYDGIELVKTIKIGNVNLTPTIAGERIPSKEELKRIIQNAIIRSKAVIALIAFAGLRFKTISGLLVSDLPEIQIDNKNKKVRFSKVPTIINVRAELSKNRLPYFTFIIEEGCNLIKDYLEFRMHQGETITEQSKLIQTPSKFTSFTKIRKNLGNSVKRAFNRARFDQRPYVLRSYFSTILDNANIQHNRQKFYTGHKGDVQMTYTLRKQLSEEMIEEMRQQFKELVEPRLSTEGSNEKEVVKGAFKRLATEIGLEVKEETPMEDTISEIAKVYKAAMEDLAKRSNNGKQKMVKESELDRYLEEGWEMVNVLPSGKLVVRQAI